MPRGVPNPDPLKRGKRDAWDIVIQHPGDLKSRVEKALLVWFGPAEGGNPTPPEFIREAIEEKLARIEKEKGPQ